MIRKEKRYTQDFLNDEKVMENEKAAENHMKNRKTMENRWKRRKT